MDGILNKTNRNKQTKKQPTNQMRKIPLLWNSNNLISIKCQEDAIKSMRYRSGFNTGLNFRWPHLSVGKRTNVYTVVRNDAGLVK